MTELKDQKGVINWKITTVILLVIFVQQAVCALLYADSPFLIAEYFPDLDSKQIGHYAGYLVSMYNIGQIPGCLFWGWYADRYGRKQPLILVTILDSILMICFGFSTNFYAAITFRFLWGVADGYLGICKTILSEICSPDMLPVTTGLIFLSMAIASTVGPIVGGYLSDPEELLKDLIKYIPYLKKDPFCIPFAICGLLGLLCTVMVMLWVDETLPKEEREKQQELSADMKRELSGIFRKRDRGESLDVKEHVMVELNNNNYFAMFKDREIVITTLLYAFEGVIQASYDTVVPVWLAAEKAVGGFAMDKKDLAWVVSFIAPMQMATLLLFPAVSKVCETKTAYLVLSAVQVVVLGVTPVVSVLNGISLRDTIVLLYMVLSTFHIVRSILFKYPLLLLLLLLLILILLLILLLLLLLLLLTLLSLS